jgi:hypothetical protein
MITRIGYSSLKGLPVKQPCILATTVDISSLSTGTPDVVDGVNVQIGNRILVKNQSSNLENGVYTVDVVGTGSDGSWSRSSDSTLDDDFLQGMQIFVISGNTNGNKTFLLETENPIQIGVTGLTFSSYISSGSGGASGSVDIITSPYSGLEITTGTTNSVIDTIYNSSLDSSLSMPTTVGGIVANTTVADLSSKTLVQLFDDLLFPTVSPTYTIPTIVASSTVTGIREIGSSISPSITLTGTENDSGPYSKLVINKSTNGAGNVSLLTVTSTASMTVGSTTNIASQFGYSDPNNPNLTYQINTSETISVPVPSSGGSSTVVYSGTGDYGVGIAKKNNKGVTHSATPAVRLTTSPQASSTNFSSNLQTVTGYYPYFFGKTSTQQTASQIASLILAGSGNKVIADGGGSLSMAFNAVGEWPWFAVYSVYNNKTAWYETPLNSGPIGAPTHLFPTPTTLTVTSPDGYWSVTYKIYPANKVTTIGTATIS